MDDAVSSMVSAVLVLAIFTAAFGVWTVDTVPEWIAAREHAHAGEVAADFAAMRSTLDTMPAGGLSATIRVDMAPDPVPLLQRAPSFGTVDVVQASDATRATLGLASAQLASVGDVVLASLVAASPATQIDDVANVMALELDVTKPGTGTNGITLDALDGTATARVTITNPAASSICEVQSLFSPSSTPSTVRRTEVPCQGGLRVNALSDLFGFDALLDRLDHPFTLDVVSASGSSIGAVTIDKNGLTRALVGSGPNAGERGIASDAIRFTPNYLEIEDRSVRFDAGGIVNIQKDVHTFVIEPVFDIDVANGAGYMRWTIVDVQASGSLSGSDAAVLEFRKLATEELVVQASGSDTVFSVASPASAAWEDMWVDALTLEAIPSNQASVSRTGDTAQLTLDASIPWTIHLTIHDVELSVT